MLRRAFEIRKSAKLSQPALEVLSVIAYYQPATRAQVDQIRGVDSAYTIGLLLDRKLIEECGRLQVPGRPRLYRTTDHFLRCFHLRSLEELPELPGMTEERLETEPPEREEGESVGRSDTSGDSGGAAADAGGPSGGDGADPGGL